MKSKRNVKLVFLALVSSLLLLMASCSDQQPIPSISSAALSVDELIQAADRYEACMTNAGFLMLRDDREEIPKVAAFWSASHNFIQLFPEGGSLKGGVYLDDSGLTPAAKDFLSNGPAPGLFYDGVDRSADYNRCLDESGYDEDAVMAYLIDLETQSQNNTRQMRANNQWADCARDNGFPNIADTSLDVLGAFIGTGAVELPVSMTTEQLKQLLQACPLVDWSMRDRLNDWLFAQDWKVDTADYPDWYIPDPMIGFDWSALPEARDPDWLAGPAGGAMADHAAELAEIVKAAQSR